MSNDSLSEDLPKSLAVLSLEGTCSMLESSLQHWNILALWMVKIVLFFPLWIFISRLVSKTCMIPC